MQLDNFRKAGKDFPYRSSTVCYIEVDKNGMVRQGGGQETYERAKTGEITLYAVWPGKWRSDLFIVSDMDEYAKALGIIHDEERTGLKDHAHKLRWKLSAYNPNPKGQYVNNPVAL